MKKMVLITLLFNIFISCKNENSNNYVKNDSIYLNRKINYNIKISTFSTFLNIKLGNSNLFHIFCYTSLSSDSILKVLNVGKIYINGELSNFATLQAYPDSVHGYFLINNDSYSDYLIKKCFGKETLWGSLGDDSLKINKCLIKYYTPKKLNVYSNTIVIVDKYGDTNYSALSISEGLKLKWDKDENFIDSLSLNLSMANSSNSGPYINYYFKDDGFINIDFNKIAYNPGDIKFKIGDTIEIDLNKWQRRKIIDTTYGYFNFDYQENLREKVILVK